MQINSEIRDREIRLIGSDGQQLGVMSAQKALEIAEREGLDLVKISPNAEIPVCKIMDYGKYKFEQQKRLKEAKKNQKIVEIKEIQLSCKIDKNDFNTKLNHAKKFIADGNKVKVSIRFRGREMAHIKLGEQVVSNFAQEMAEFAVIEKEPKFEGRSIMLFLAPKNNK